MEIEYKKSAFTPRPTKCQVRLRTEIMIICCFVRASPRGTVMYNESAKL
jgi:hypothetical protein